MMTLADISSDVVPLVAIGGGCTVAVVAIMVGGISGAVRTKAKEQTRREVAAYVAEGSMTPEEAERLLKAGRSMGSCGKQED